MRAEWPLSIPNLTRPLLLLLMPSSGVLFLPTAGLLPVPLPQAMLLLPETIVLPAVWAASAAVCLRWAAVLLEVIVLPVASVVSVAVLLEVIVLPVASVVSVAVSVAVLLPLAALAAVSAVALLPLVMRVPERFSRKMPLPIRIRIPIRVQLPRKNPHLK